MDTFKESFKEEFYANENKKKEALKEALKESSKPPVDNKNKTSTSRAPPAPPKVPEPTTTKPRQKTEFLSKLKVLYIGDSVAQNMDAKIVEKAKNIRMRTEKAYSSVADKKAKWPYKNVKNVTEKLLDEAPKADEFQHLILAAPTVDITNLDTARTKPTDNVEYFKQKVVISCQSMFTTAQNALLKHPKLKNVTLMEHPPRFDTADKDPSSLKPQLAKFANNYLQQLWSNSSLKHKIVVGQHNLLCDGKIRQARFTRTLDKKYDGIHMYGVSGRAAYMRSVSSIISSIIQPQVPAPTEADMTQYTPSSGIQNNYNVKVNNVFDILGN